MITGQSGSPKDVRILLLKLLTKSRLHIKGMFIVWNFYNRLFRSQIDAYDPTLLDLSNQELTRLWKISINNLDACKSDSRNFQSNQSGFELASDV